MTERFLTAQALRESLRIDGHLSITASGQDAVFGTLSLVEGAVSRHRGDDITKEQWLLLQKAVSDFKPSHVAESLTWNKNRNLFKVTHQPNFLAGLNVTGAALLLSSFLTDSGCVLYTFVDYTTGRDPRLRSSLMPIGFDSTSVLRSPIPPAQRDRVAYTILPPRQEHVRHWINVLRYSLKVTERDLRKASIDTRHPREAQYILDELADLWPHFLQQSRSTAEFNSYVTINLLQRMTTGNILGVSGERLFAIAGLSMTRIIRDRFGPRSLVDSGDWWLVCAHCNRRIECVWRWSDQEVNATCNKCNRTYRGAINFGTPRPSDRARVLPRVRADVLLDYAWLPASAYGSYAGSVSHLIRTRSRAVRSGVQVPPELVWDPVNLLGPKPTVDLLGPGAQLLSRGRAPLLHYYLLFPTQKFREALLAGSRLGEGGCQQPIASLQPGRYGMRKDSDKDAESVL